MLAFAGILLQAPAGKLITLPLQGTGRHKLGICVRDVVIRVSRYIPCGTVGIVAYVVIRNEVVVSVWTFRIRWIPTTIFIVDGWNGSNPRNIMTFARAININWQTVGIFP